LVQVSRANVAADARDEGHVDSPNCAVGRAGEAHGVVVDDAAAAGDAADCSDVDQ
jgi:hypothetical protein